MARVFVTGSSDGLGQTAAQLLLVLGHQVVLHARNEQRAKDALAAVPGAVQIGHRCQVVHQVNRQAAVEQPFTPRLDRNVLKGDRAAKRLRIILCIEVHVLGLRTGKVIATAAALTVAAR